MIGVPLVGMFYFVFDGTEKISFLTFGRESLYLESVGSDVCGLVNFLGLLLLTGSLIEYYSYYFGSDRFKEYFSFSNYKFGFNFEVAPFFAFAIKLTILYYLLMSPILILSLHNYKAIYLNKIVDNSFFSWEEHAYPIDQIKNATIRTKFTNKGEIWMNVIDIKLKNNKSIELDGGPKWNGNELKMYQISKTLNQLNIPVVKNTYP